MKLATIVAILSLIPLANVNAAEQESSLRVSSSLAEYPDNPDFYDDNSESGNKFLLREVLTGGENDGIRYEVNTYLLLNGSSNKVSGLSVLSSGTEEVNRSSYLDHHWHSSDAFDGYLNIDRLNLKGALGKLQWAAGRFPINFSTTYIFTPNDLFSPFRPHHAYREYKPGVDAVRADLQWGELGQISAIGVAGFSSSSKIGRVGIQKENHFSPGESSAILRVTNTYHGYELALFGGKNGEFDIAGFSSQGEWFDQLGVKAEGHQKKSRRDGFAATEVAVAFDYRLAEPLLFQFEEFYHGAGYRRASQYRELEEDPHPPLYFLGTNYSAVMLNYDVTSLTQLRPIFIGNHTDQSAMVYLSVQHSVAENSELSASVLMPRGKGPDKEFLRSEYGAYPKVLTIDFGIYF